MGIPSQSEGSTSRSAAFEQRRDIVAPAEPVRPVDSAKGRESIRACKAVAIGAVAGQGEVPVGAIGRDLRGGLEQRRDPFLGVEPADDTGPGSAPAGTPRLARSARPGAVERGGIDAVGDHGQAVGVEPRLPRS